jgi:hypothetical protein
MRVGAVNKQPEDQTTSHVDVGLGSGAVWTGREIPRVSEIHTVSSFIYLKLLQRSR